MLRSATILAAVLVPGLALAQAKPISVFFSPTSEQQLNEAITAAMVDQGFLLVAKPGPGVVAVNPGKVEVKKGKYSGTTWDFAVAFSRDGSSLGHSQEGCNDKKLSDCTDQLMSDIKSAAGMP